MVKTGFLKTPGEATETAVDIAVSEINASGGINGKQIKLIKYDTGSQAKQAVVATQKFARDDKEPGEHAWECLDHLLAEGRGYSSSGVFRRRGACAASCRARRGDPSRSGASARSGPRCSSCKDRYIF